MSVRIAIVGPGNIARRFAENANAVETVELVAVASRSFEKAKAFADVYGIEKVYGSYDEMYADPDIDAVYIALPHNFHAEQVRKSLNSGKSVISEKPAFLSVEEAVELTNLAKEKKLTLMEAMWTRYLPTTLKVCEWINDGKIGDLKLIEASFPINCPEDASSRMYAPELAGGALYDLGVYPYAFATFIAGAPVKEYCSMVTPAFTGVDETQTALIKFENNAIAQISSGLQISGKTSDAFIYGNKGKIVVPVFWGSKTATLFDNDGKEVETFDCGYEDMGQGFRYEIMHFAELVKSGAIESPSASHQYIIDCCKFFEDSLKELK